MHNQFLPFYNRILAQNQVLVPGKFHFNFNWRTLNGCEFGLFSAGSGYGQYEFLSSEIMEKAPENVKKVHFLTIGSLFMPLYIARVSVVDHKLLFSDPDPTFQEILDPAPDLI